MFQLSLAILLLVEVAQGAAILVNPTSELEISKAIEKIIKYPKLRKKWPKMELFLAQNTVGF